jgi:hypothetical protein
MEPEILRRGKAFHKRVQADWSGKVEGASSIPEHSIRIVGGGRPGSRHRRGRLDIFIDLISDFVTVVEIKSTDWDQIQPRSRSKLLASHRRQVLRYVDKYLDEDRVSVCAGIIYPAPPADPTVRLLVEEYLNGYALQVVWYDEPIGANTRVQASV